MSTAVQESPLKTTGAAPAELYLSLLSNVLTNTAPHAWRGTHEAFQKRVRGMDWPAADDPALTMIGIDRLSNIWNCAVQVFLNRVPGDFMECGVWRGGAAMFMRAIQKAYAEDGRRTWVCDSFQGAPVPNPAVERDRNDPHHTFDFLRVSEEQVRKNFASLGLADDNVRFLAGFVQHSLPNFVAENPGARLAILRADCDTYEATTAILENLYPLVSPGGFVICDDYRNIPNCRAAIDDFRRRRGVREPLEPVDWCAAYWRKQ